MVAVGCILYTHTHTHTHTHNPYKYTNPMSRGEAENLLGWEVNVLGCAFAGQRRVKWAVFVLVDDQCIKFLFFFLTATTLVKVLPARWRWLPSPIPPCCHSHRVWCVAGLLSATYFSTLSEEVAQSQFSVRQVCLSPAVASKTFVSFSFWFSDYFQLSVHSSSQIYA